MNKHSLKFVKSVKFSLDNLDIKKIDKIKSLISKVQKNKGRIFFLGVGGSAANASHAVNDFRKICNIECYSPSDNISELTARINDDGWDTSYLEWLKVSKLNAKDLIFIFSVGGGSISKKISMNLIKSINYAKLKNAKICGIIGKKEGYLNKYYSESTLVIKTDNKKFITPIVESFQSIIWHLLVSDTSISIHKTKW